MRTRTLIIVAGLAAVAVMVAGGLTLAAPPSDAPPATIAKGGQLYDNWWKTAGVAEPKGDQPLWATQTTNTRKGLDTWRCKECHGWDYKGKDGAYGSGSHKTGFVGVVDAAKNKTQEQIAAILKGSSSPNHNFGTVLDDANINALAAFVKEGVVQDLTQFVDYSTKKPKGADAARGRQLFTDTCSACHAADGTKLNFGSDQAPEFVGTVAADNPQEFLHKVRFGQPGAPMPSGVQLGWSVKDGVDVLAHAQSLPTKPAAAAAPSATIAKGGQLYDNWWKTAGVAEPKGDQPLWATQTTNTRKGLDTWRCKECHGWDYRGKDGAYGSGSHKTGFVGVVDAAKNKTQEQIAAILKGSGNPNHNFATVLDDANINALAAFLKDGVVQDLTQFVDYATKKPKGADAARGKQLYTNTCTACHGSDGTTLNFGSDQAPEFVGTIAADNPQEFLHKVQFGQPGTSMPSGVQAGWTTKDGADVLAHSQTLPTKPAAAAVASPTPTPPPAQLPKTGEPSLGLFAALGILLLTAGVAARKLSGGMTEQ